MKKIILFVLAIFPVAVVSSQEIDAGCEFVA